MPRAMEIVTPLGAGRAVVPCMHAREELSRLSDFRVELLSHPDNGDIELDEILGQNVTIRLGLADEGSRFFNGFVTRFAQVGKHGRYNRFIASVQPWTWFLTRTADCRIFQDMTVPDIVKAVFTEHRDDGFQVRSHQHLSQVDLLRAVPRDRLQFHQPVARARGHLLLLRAHQRSSHDDADRFDRQAHGDGRI